MNEREKMKGKSGFTLMELLVATLLISILFLPLLTVLNKELTSSYKTRIFQMALVLAQEEMEEAMDKNISERKLNDRKREIHLMNHTFQVERDVLNGEEKGEPSGGTDPLEVWVRVYHGEEKNPVVRLVTLKEDW
jgi:prepilin-type N-terminal cleavage/methylation domain-containing protein